MRDLVIPNPALNGLWYVSSQPINKFELLRLVGEIYGKQIEIIPDDSVKIDSSLDGSCGSGYSALSWRELVS
jgi:dTDP-4-dehydrorhamnose reductase